MKKYIRFLLLGLITLAIGTTTLQAQTGIPECIAIPTGGGGAVGWAKVDRQDSGYPLDSYTYRGRVNIYPYQPALQTDLLDYQYPTHGTIINKSNVRYWPGCDAGLVQVNYGPAAVKTTGHTKTSFPGEFICLDPESMGPEQQVNTSGLGAFIEPTVRQYKKYKKDKNLLAR